MQTHGNLGASGVVHNQVLRGGSLSSVPAVPIGLKEVWRYGNKPDMRRLWAQAAKFDMARALGIPFISSALSLVVIRKNGYVEDLGIVSLRVVTTAGVNFLVDVWQNSVELENMKFHAIGTGSTAEAVGDTALVTELTTQYNPDNTRATGSLTEGASANIFRTVGTNAVDASVAITEHGILTQAATGGGTLWDRSVFSAINLGSGDSLQSTYDCTITAGS